MYQIYQIYTRYRPDILYLAKGVPDIPGHVVYGVLHLGAPPVKHLGEGAHIILEVVALLVADPTYAITPPLMLIHTP